MPRLLFVKTDDAVWISHLDLMRLFQRAFKRAGLNLTHTQGFNQRPSVSIAMPLSVGVSSGCELLDFDLDGQNVSCEEIKERLNRSLIQGVKVLEVYTEGKKIKYLAFLDCEVTLGYDNPLPADGVNAIKSLFNQNEIMVEKKGKNGVSQTEIASMIKSMDVFALDNGNILLKARICCQNPSLNPMLLAAAVEKYLPELTPDFVRCNRVEILDTNYEIFR